MNSGNFTSVIVVVGGAATIAVAVLLLKSQPIPSGDEHLEVIRGLCNRDVIIPERYRAKATEVKQQLVSGSVDRWKDLSFRSKGDHGDVYVPYPDVHLNDAGFRLNLVDVYLGDDKVFEMTIPVVLLKNPVMSFNLPEHRYRSCLDFFNKDFVDYM